jgi:hypothetical protein
VKFVFQLSADGLILDLLLNPVVRLSRNKFMQGELKPGGAVLLEQ